MPDTPQHAPLSISPRGEAGDPTPTTQAAVLDRMFQALADTNRRAMIERLCLGPAAVTELASPLSIGMPAVLKHLTTLESSGILMSTKSGRVRTYCLSADAFVRVEEWLGERKACFGEAA
jgi:DNA-binding transcriptional ArsR family regulator